MRDLNSKQEPTNPNTKWFKPNYIHIEFDLDVFIIGWYLLVT
jgi:hypothetical protein